MGLDDSIVIGWNNVIAKDCVSEKKKDGKTSMCFCGENCFCVDSVAELNEHILIGCALNS